MSYKTVRAILNILTPKVALKIWLTSGVNANRKEILTHELNFNFSHPMHDRPDLPELLEAFKKKDSLIKVRNNFYFFKSYRNGTFYIFFVLIFFTYVVLDLTKQVLNHFSRILRPPNRTWRRQSRYCRWLSSTRWKGFSDEWSIVIRWTNLFYIYYCNNYFYYVSLYKAHHIKLNTKWWSHLASTHGNDIF